MDPPVYAPEFELFWSNSDRLGSKSDAFRAWEQVRSPAADLLVKSRQAWLAHWDGIGVKHIATWLRAFDWRQEPAPKVSIYKHSDLPLLTERPARNFREEVTADAFARARAAREGKL